MQFNKLDSVDGYNPLNLTGETKRLKRDGQKWHYLVGTQLSLGQLGSEIYTALGLPGMAPKLKWYVNRNTKNRLGTHQVRMRYGKLDSTILLYKPTLGIFLHELAHGVQRERQFRGDFGDYARNNYRAIRPHGREFQAALRDVRYEAEKLVDTGAMPREAATPIPVHPERPMVRRATRVVPDERDMFQTVGRTLGRGEAIVVDEFAIMEGCSAKAIRQAIDKLRRKGMQVTSMGGGTFQVLEIA